MTIYRLQVLIFFSMAHLLGSETLPTKLTRIAPDVRIASRHSVPWGYAPATKVYTYNVTTSGRNCNTIFDVLTSKMPNADRQKHVFVWGDFVLINRNIKMNMIEKIVIYGPSFPRTLALNSASYNVPSET